MYYVLFDPLNCLEVLKAGLWLRTQNLITGVSCAKLAFMQRGYC